MIEAPIPFDEELRLKNLKDLMVLDSEAEKQFDDLVLLASQLTECPVSLISLVDKDRQWFKAKTGILLEESPRDTSFCGHAITQEGENLFTIQNTLDDERFNDNPLVTENPKIRFYAGQPLVTTSGKKIGTLCVMDTKPRSLTKEQEMSLQIISSQAVALMELRKDVVRERAESLKKISFVSAMSHEIRTPLTALSGYIEILSDESTEEERKKYGTYFNALKSNSKHLLELVGNVLDFSKLEVNKVDVKKDKLNTQSLINHINNVFKLEAEKKGIDFEITADNLPKFLETDSTFIKQIIINLVSNALKFTSKGFVKVALFYEDSTHKFTVEVEDTGPGISADDQERIFYPFAQAVEGEAKMLGTGLGLNISKQLSELLGGGVKLKKTELGRGSIFEAWVVADTATKPLKIKSIVEKKEGSLEGAKKVLVVDDSPDNRFLLTHFLKDSGISFDEACNGQEALSLAGSNKYDYIFLDMQLPDMNGFDVFEALNKNTVGEIDPGVIAFTASSTEKERQRCFEKGFKGFLSKPFSKRDVSSLFGL